MPIDPVRPLAGNAHWLSLLELDPPGPRPVFQRLARLASQVTGFPVGLVTFVSEHGQWNAGRHGFAHDFLACGDAICPLLLPAAGPLAVPDTWRDPRFAEHPLVVGPQAVRAYAGHPVAFQGLTLGTVCVLDTVPHRLTPDREAALADLAATVTEVLQQLDDQRRLREERSRAIDFARASGDWFWELDHRLNYAWLSPNFTDQTGLDAERLLHEPIADAPVVPRLPDEPPTTLRELVLRRESFGGVVVELDLRGQRRLVALNALARHDDSGRFCGFRGSARDVTERILAVRAAEEQALQRERELRANEAKAAFLSRASHELRTPLNAIIGFSQLIRLESGEALEGPLGARLDIIRRAADHLLGLVDDLLDLSRLEMRAQVPTFDIDLRAVLDECLALLSLDISQRGLQVDHAVPAGVRVCAEPSALRRVLLNLLSNAVKYNHEGGRLGLHVEHEGPARVRLCIRDSGPGIPESDQARLFEPFNRLGAELTGVPGTGLGLMIARGLARAMGGDLMVRSLPGRGTTAVVLLRAP